MMADSPYNLLAARDVEHTRKLYAAHIEAGGTAEVFAPEPMRPEKGLDFAFIGRAPKRKSMSSYYRCSFCQTDRKFAAGNVVLSADGLLRLIGPDCWREHIDPEQYNAQEADLRDYELQERFAINSERIRIAVCDAVPRVLTLAYASKSLLDLAENLPKVIESDATGFKALMQRIRPDNGRLLVEASVPDERAGKDERGRYLKYRLEQTLLHKVAGLDAAFSSHTGLTSLARQAYQELRNAASAIPQGPSTGANAPTAKAIRAIQGQLGKAARHLATLRDVMALFQAFLAPANLRGIALWSQHGDCADEHLARAITFDEDGLTVVAHGTNLVLSVPAGLAGFTVPDLDEVSRLLKLT